MMKVNETHVHAVYEMTKVLNYFRFAVEGLKFFLLVSISNLSDGLISYQLLGELCRNLV